MNVVAINASPRMESGNTADILMPFLEGIKEAGANVELFLTRKLTIHPCQGDFSCWLNTPGKCFQKDDMEILLPRLAKADLWVFATPLYVDGMAGTLKNLFDRAIPLLQPFFEIRDGHCRHPLREGVRSGKFALVASCGFWELDNFEPLLAHARAICRNLKREFSGALLRPHSRALKMMLKTGESANDILEAARSAGRQLVREGCMSDQTVAAVSRPLMERDAFLENVNAAFRKALDELKTG
ncbi:MAG: flavodoxin family protein [Desulfuromonadales bacterium]|nr:flavodoxin family protein [Desulfuromonadales bacterium]